jgi:hypothetical protein
MQLVDVESRLHECQDLTCDNFRSSLFAMPWLDCTWCGQDVYQEHEGRDIGAPVERDDYDCIDYNRNIYPNDSDNDSGSRRRRTRGSF